MIMTGQAQTGGYSQSQFKTYVCGQISVLFDCANGIYIDVQSYPAFTGVIDHRPDRRQQEFRAAPSTTAPAAPATSSSCGCSINGRCSSPGSATTSRI